MAIKKYKMLVSCLIVVLLIFACLPILWGAVTLTKITTFFVMMNNVPVSVTDSSEEYSLAELEKAATFLLTQSEPNRRRMIAAYDVYQSYVDTESLKLYILLRLLYNVSPNYPQEKARYFGGWVFIPDRSDTGEAIDLLWPVADEDERLILSTKYYYYLGPPYAGLEEYDYFAVHFPLRGADEFIQ